MGMEKHLDRIEVKDAVSKGMGTSVRRSETFGIDMLYVASPFEDKGKIIRLSMPMVAVKAIEDKIMILLTFGLYLTPVVAIIICFFFTQYMAYRDQGRG